MKYLIGFVFLFCFDFSQAQTKSFAAVTDEKGNAIGGASIHVLNTDIYLVADDAGRFSLPSLPKGVYNVEISAVGFARIEKQLKFPLSGEMLIYR